MPGRTKPLALLLAAAVTAPAVSMAATRGVAKPRLVTTQVRRQIGTPSTFSTAKALMGRLVATTRKSVAKAGDGGPAKVKWTLTVKATGASATASGSVTVSGLADDSLAGWTTTVLLQRLSGGTYDPVRWRLLRAERRDVCTRGVSATRARCV